MNDFELNEAAKRLMKNEMYKNALFLLDQIETPEFLFKKYANSAVCYMELEEYEKAVELNKKAIGIDDSNDKIYYNLGNIYVDSGKKELALKYYMKALECAGCNYQTALYNMANLYYSINEYEKALECILKTDEKEGIKEKGEVFGILYRKLSACIYYKLKDYKNAVKYFEENKDLVYKEKFFKMLVCYFHLKEFKKLFGCFFDLYINNENYKRLKLKRCAKRAMNKKQYKKAFSCIDKIEKSYFAHEDIMTEGICLLNLKQYDDAAFYFREFIDREPYDFQGYLNLALTYSELKEYEKSHPLWIKAIELSGCEEETVKKYIEQYNKINEYDKVIKTGTEALKLYTKNYNKECENYFNFLYSSLAHAYYMKNEFKNVIACISKIKYKNSELFFEYGYCLGYFKQYKKAYRAFILSFLLKPNFNAISYLWKMSAYLLNTRKGTK